MINKFSKGKEHTRRPLPVRALAILLAFAMVLSVLYISNRRNKVEAGTPTYPTITDSVTLGNVGEGCFLPSIGSDYSQAYAFTPAEYTLNVPSDKVTFNLHDYGSFNYSGTVYKGSDEKYYFNKPEGVDSGIDVTGKFTTQWENASGTAITTVTPGQTIYLTGAFTDIKQGETSITVEDAASYKKTLIKLNVVQEAFSDVVASKTGVTDANISNRASASAANTMYYGNVSLTQTVGSDSEPTTLENINGLISKLPENGKYTATLKKEVFVDNDGDSSTNPVVVASIDTAVSVANNETLITSVWYKIGDGEKQTLTASEGSYSIASLDPTKKITVGITTDISLNTTSDVSVTGTSSLNKSGDNDIYWEIAADAAANQGTNKTFTVTASDSAYFPEGFSNTASFTVNVGYDNGKPAISDITVNQKTVQKDSSDADVYYVNEDSAIISAKATIANTTNGTVASALINGADATLSEGIISGTLTGLNKGSNDVTISATSNYGVSSGDTTIKVFYDPDAPTVTPDIAQTGYPGSGKYTCKKNATISFTVSDGDSGSGVKTFKVKDENDNTVSTPIEIAADDANNAKTLTYTYTAIDYAGKTTTGSVSIEFANEVASVEYSVTKGNYLNSENKTHGIIWAPEDFGESVTSRDFVVEYHVTSEVSISSAKVNGNDVTFTYNSSTGKYDITYTKSTTVGTDEVFDENNSTGWKLEVTNANGHTTTHTLKLVQIDLTNPGNTKSTSSALAPEAIEDWYQSVVINVVANDVTAGIKSIIATNVDGADSKDIFTGEAGTTDWSGNVDVNESTGGVATSGTITVNDRAGNSNQQSFEYKVDKTPPEASIEINGEPASGTLYLESVDSFKFIATDANLNDAKTKVYIGSDTTGISIDEAKSKADFATLVGETPQQNKAYTLKLVAYDKSGRSTTASVDVVLDNVPPVPTITVVTPAPRTPGYYNKDNEYVEINLEVKDTNIKSIVVKDGNDDITPADDEWTKTSDSWTATIKVTSEGTHTISMTAEDKSLLKKDATPQTIYIDRTDPNVTTQLNGSTYTSMSSHQISPVTTGVVVTDTYKDSSNGVAVKITRDIPGDGSTVENKTGEGPFEIKEDGDYTVEYIVTDLAGNSVTKTIGFTVDASKPVHNMYVTTSAAKSAKYSTTYSNKVGKFNDYSDQEEYTYGQYFNTDVFIDVAYFDYNIESVTVYDNGTPINVNWATDGGYGRGTIAISSEGYHEIKMSSVDKSGNAVTDSGSSALYFTIDKTDPELTTYLNGAEYSADNAHVEKGIAQVSISDANPDDDDIVLIAVRELPAGGSDNSSYAGVNGLEFTLDGYYSVSYTVTDKAGNSSTATYGFYVDTESPVHNMYVTSENPPKFSSYKNTYSNPVGVFNARASQENYEYGQYYNGNVNVELNVFDYNLDWVYVSDNGVELSPTWTWNGAYGTATVTLMSEGYHELKMWSKDLSGNETDDTDPAKMIRLYIDKTAPGITTYVNGSLYSEGSGVRYLNTNASVQVSVNDTNKDTTDLVRTSKMTPPGGSASSSTENVGETTENYSTEADYEVQYVATDLAGNKSGTRNVQFRVDKTPPQLSINGDGTSTAKSVPVSFGIKEAFYWDMTSAKYSIYKKKDGTGESLEKTTDFTPRSSNDSQSYTITEDAEYRFEFSAEDKCGNKTETKGTLIKDGTAPIILLSGVSNYDKTDKEVTLNISVDEAFYSTNKVTLTGTRTDIDGKTTNIDFNQFTTNRTKVSQLEQLFKEDGIYDITVTSTDKAGNSSTKTLHFTIDTTDPEIGDLSKYDKVKTNKFEWDVDLDELVKDLTVCDISVYMDGSLYDGTTEIADGSHVLRVEAVDELGHKSYKEVTFVLDTKGPNIIISNVEDGDRLLESTEVTVTVEIDEDLLDTVSLNDKSVTVSENKATFTINSKGKYRINATAHDEAGNTSSTEIEFTFGKQANILLIAIIAGVAIILLIILMLLIKRRRENYY